MRIFTIVVSIIMGNLALARGTEDLSSYIDSPRPSSETISKLSPIKNESYLTLHSIKNFFSTKDYPDLLKIESSKPRILRLTGATSRDIKFYLNEIPLCEYSLRVHDFPHGERMKIGAIPSGFSVPTLDKWPDLNRSIDLIKETLKESSVLGSSEYDSSEKCYIIRDETAIPSWRIMVSDGPKLFRGITNGYEVFDLEPFFFHASAKTVIYPNNKLDTATEEFTIENMNENGRLDNDSFFTALDPSSTKTLAKSTEGVFSFDPDTSHFEETSVFTNANRTLDWFKSIGYQGLEGQRIKLVLHAVFNGNSNNALYQPGTNGSTIYVGDGDGTMLKNLATDADVVSHEFGHHVLYSTLTSINGQSLVLHEGLSDFFTFAKSNNACLGESICPPQSKIKCAIDEQCLRTARNSFKYGGSDLPIEAHLRSQFISGMMWDLKEIDGIDINELAGLLLSAIELFASGSGYRDLVITLLLANNSAGTPHCQTILNRAIERGLKPLISDIECNNQIPAVGSETGSTSDNTETKSGGSNLCGSLGLASGPSQAVLFALPIALVVFRRRNRGSE